MTAEASSLSEYDDESEVYSASLPPTLPVVKSTIDSLVGLAAKQRIFVSLHADKLKLQLVKEMPESAPIGEWRLNDFTLTDEDAIDFVRLSPDSLSNLTYIAYNESSVWSKLTSWLWFGNSRRGSPSSLDVADDLGFALAVAEVVEVYGNILSVVSRALSTQSPRVGKSLRSEVAFELTRSRHRGDTHSMYLLATVVHAYQKAASGRYVATFKVDTSLYIYIPDFLGGVSGVAVNVSGTRADDIPNADIDAAQLRRVLARKGTFVSSAVSDFVLDSRNETTPARVAQITSTSTQKLVTSANEALSAFFDSESAEFEASRDRARAEKARIEREMELAKKEEEDELFRLEAKESELVDMNGGQYDNTLINDISYAEGWR